MNILIKKSFYMLWGTQTVSNIADIVYQLSLITLVFTTSGSLVTTIFIPLLRLLSKTVSGLVAPVVMARYPLTAILFGSQLGQFVLFTGLIGYLWMTPSPSFPLIFVIVFGMSFLDGWTDPARNALIPRLANDKGLIKANGLMSVSDQVVRCSGWALGGIIVAVIGALPTMWIASASYFVAMFFTAFIRDPYARAGLAVATEAEAAVDTTNESAAKSSYRAQLSSGWKALLSNRRVRLLAIVDNIDTLGGAAWIGAFVLAFVIQVLHQDVRWLGFMNAGFFIGSIVGGLLMVTIGQKLWKNAYGYMLMSLMVYVAIVIVFALNVQPLPALILLMLTGLPVQVAGVIRSTLIQQNLTPAEAPSVMSALSALSNLTFAVAMLFLSWFADRFGMRDMYLLAGLLTTVAVVVGIVYRSVFRQELAVEYEAEELTVANKA
ncbi:MFS transporter [Paenibacillus campi]|uniref:MFS transporter n=1 Tax=Paenibacillus campi TaxID=3106031 RepID=UPI002AFEC230|nr:MFS transporter [Paenibacillus sp. SGZ-1009]